MTGAPLSREAIRAMPHTERVARMDEIQAWLAAGARDGEAAPLHDAPLGEKVDGEAAPLHDAPLGEKVSRSEVRAMSEAERIRRAPELARMLAEGRITP